MTAPVWEWPDAAGVVVASVQASLGPAVKVRTRVPTGPIGPALPLVRVQRVGGARDVALDQARVLIECWAVHEEAAWALCSTVRDELRRLPHPVLETGGPTASADPVTGTPRYLLTVVLTLRPATVGSSPTP